MSRAGWDAGRQEELAEVFLGGAAENAAIVSNLRDSANHLEAKGEEVEFVMAHLMHSTAERIEKDGAERQVQRRPMLLAPIPHKPPPR